MKGRQETDLHDWFKHFPTSWGGMFPDIYKFYSWSLKATHVGTKAKRASGMKKFMAT